MDVLQISNAISSCFEIFHCKNIDSEIKGKTNRQKKVKTFHGQRFESSNLAKRLCRHLTMKKKIIFILFEFFNVGVLFDQTFL